MRLTSRKLFILSIFFIACCAEVQADDAATTALNAPTTTNAMSFAMQAGYIGGAAQGCGQDLTVYNARIGEALDRLALSPTDKVMAMSSFQKTLLQARTAQTEKQLIPCNQVLQDFIGLPLMREDYQQTVLTQLSPSMGSPPFQQPAPQVAANVMPVAPASVPTPVAPIPAPTVANNTIPQPATPPAPQNYNPYAAPASPNPPIVTNNSSPTNLAYAAPQNNPATQGMNKSYTQTIPPNATQSYQAAVDPSNSSPPPYSARN